MLRYLLDLTGVAVFAVSGALAAGRRGLDIIGVVVLGAVTAIGGGTVRDVLLARHPIAWLADPTYLILIVASSLATIAYVRWRPAPRAALQVADALGLALFSVVGAQIAESEGLPAVSCVLLGTVTGTAGGIIRDVLTAQVPLVLRQGNLYATAAIVGTSSYFALEGLGVSRVIAAYVGMIVCVMLRAISIHLGVTLPVFVLGDRDHS